MKSMAALGKWAVSSLALLLIGTPLVAQVGGGVYEPAPTLTTILGTLGADKGGTGNTSYAVGDVLYASGATTLSKLADIATGNALISGGVTTAPSWGKVGLTTHVSGVLDAANGGTGVANNTAATTTKSGNFALTQTLTAPSNVTYPTTGTLATLAGAETLTTKTITAPILSSVAWASLPSPGNAGKLARCSDCGTKGSLWMDDGTIWKPLNGEALLASLDTASTGVNASETIKLQYQMPAAFLRVGDRLRIIIDLSKSGATNTGVVAARMGTAGTTGGDTALWSSTIMSTAQRTASVILDFRVESATTIQPLGNTASGYGSATTTTLPAAVTISNISNSLFLDVSITGGATDTVSMTAGQIWVASKAN